MILNRDKFEVIREIKYVCSILECDCWEFAKEVGLEGTLSEEDFPEEAWSVYERGDSNIGDKIKSIWNFISLKGTKIRSLGKQLTNAIRIRLNSLLLAKEKINNSSVELEPEKKNRILDIAKDKEKTAGDLESSLKDKIDAIADGDSRLEKIASIAKTNAAIKPQQEKIKILQNLEYSDNTINDAKERQKKLVDELRRKTQEFQEELKRLKEKENSSKKPDSGNSKSDTGKKDDPKDGADDEHKKKIEIANNLIDKHHAKMDSLKKELADVEEKLSKYENPNGANSNKKDKLEYEIKETSLLIIEQRIKIALYNGDKDKEKDLRDHYKKLEEELNKKKRVSSK